jgi:hypothetical protein
MIPADRLSPQIHRELLCQSGLYLQDVLVVRVHYDQAFCTDYILRMSLCRQLRLFLHAGQI